MRSSCLLVSLLAALVLRVPVSAANDGPAPLSEWASETIELPPGFAPKFTSGVEHLLFPPGWRDPESENFWSYAIVMRLDEPLPDIARVEALMREYYAGLMSAFGVGRKEGSPPNDVRVTARQAGDLRFDATMDLIDGFATLESVQIRLLIETDEFGQNRSELRIRVSRQPEGHAIWAALDGAIREISAEHPGRSPMPNFARMIDGEWRLGERQFDVWRWGPGKHSIVGRTMGLVHEGESTSGVLRVFAWNPRREEVSVLSLSLGGLVSEGVATVRGNEVHFDTKLHYGDDEELRKYIPEGGPRHIIHAWRFDGPDTFDAFWIEDMGSRDPEMMPSWRYERAERVTPDPPSASDPPAEIKRLGAFVPLIGKAWSAKSAREGGETIMRRIEFAWVPYAEAVHARVHEQRNSEAPVLVEETVIYPHPGNDQIRAITLHASGAVDEGVVARLEHGVIQIEAPGVVRGYTIGDEGLLIERSWDTDGAERTPRSEVLYRQR